MLEDMMDIPRVFVGSATESLEVAEAVQANLQSVCEARVWNQGLVSVGEPVLQSLLKLARTFDLAILIATSDESANMRGSPSGMPRDNVIFEAGMFCAAIGSERVFMLVEATVRIPSDLAGVVVATFNRPNDGNYIAATAPALVGIKARVKELGRRHAPNTVNDTRMSSLEPTLYPSRRVAWDDMRRDCKASATISVLANRGVIFFGTDDSIVSLAEIHEYTRLQKLRLVLLSDRSRWIHEGYVLLRSYESLELFKKELEATHLIVESAMRRLGKKLVSSKSGVRYHRGEPHFRMLMTDNAAYVSSYAEPPGAQARDLPVYRFTKGAGSLFGAFKRHFDDLWHNHSMPGVYEREVIDLETSAGGIVFCCEQGKFFVTLLQRHDGYWVLPKGHKLVEDASLEETATREVSEETGLAREKLLIVEHVGYYTYDETIDSLGINKVVHLFLMKLCETERLPLRAPDHASAVWWPIDDAMPRMKSSYQATYLRQVIELLRT